MDRWNSDQQLAFCTTTYGNAQGCAAVGFGSHEVPCRRRSLGHVPRSPSTEHDLPSSSLPNWKESVLIFPVSRNLGKNPSGTPRLRQNASVNTKPPSTVVLLAICDNHLSRRSQEFEGSGTMGKFHQHSSATEVDTGTEEMEERVLIK